MRINPIFNYNLAFSSGVSKPVYVLKKDIGMVERIDSAKSAREKFGFSLGKIYNGPVYIDNDTVLVYGNILESKDESNQPYLDDNKVNKMFQTLGWGDVSTNIYAIKANGEYQKFSSAKDAAVKLGVPEQSVRQIIQKRFYTSGEYTFVKASEFEAGKDKTKINEELYQKALLRFSQAKKQAIYVVDIQTGEIKLFDTPQEAAQCTGATKSIVSSVLALNKPQVYSKNLSYLKVIDVAKKGEFGQLLLDEEGKPIPDVKKINKVREQALDGTITPIVGIRKDGSYRIIKSSKEIIDELGVVSNTVSRSLNGTPRESKGFAYVRLREVLLRDCFGNAVFDEENRFIVDEYEIEKISKQVYLK